jgi:predicted ATP-grasp superfamily ATP-dependent carboligase
LLKDDVHVVMPISIESFRFCAQHKATLLDNGIRVLVSDLATWERLYNKARTYELAESYGIPVPRSISVSATDYGREIERADLGPRLVIKGAEEGGARFVRYAESVADCGAILSDFVHQDADVFRKGVLAQEYIEGTACAYFCLADQGSVLAEFGHRRIHQNPPTGGVSTCCASFRNGDMFGYGRVLVRNERYSGPCMIEFKHDRERNRFVLIEVNPKFWGSSLLSIICGVNFPVLYVRHLLGESLEQGPVVDRTLQFVAPDLGRAVRHPSCFGEFLKMLFHPGVSKDVPYFGVLTYLNYYVWR